MKKNIVGKLLLILAVVLVSPFSSFGQQTLIKPVTWKLTVSKQNVKIGDEVELIFKTNDIPDKWHLYSNDFTTEGPQKAEFTYEKSAAYKLLTPVPKPIGQIKEYDDVWEGDVTFFKHNAEFRHKLKVLSANPTVKVNLYYQMCDEQCVQFEVDLQTTITTVGGGNTTAEPKTTEIVDTPEKTEEDTDTTTKTEVLSGGCCEDVKALTNALVEKGVIDPIEKTIDTGSGEYKNPDRTTSILAGGDCEVKTFAGDVDEKDNLILFFIIAFLSGLVALLTPCVFPMIPMTVTFFLKGSGGKAKGLRNALLYGTFIIVIYTIIGTIFSAVFGATGANEFSTNAVVNIIFFLVFVIFAISFFGVFEITLPSKFVNKMDKQSDRGGLTGVFFMAFTLVLVSFSCTGPIVGSILVEASQGSYLRPVVGMLGFSLAFALPFTLFAIFPKWLEGLPKSGGWLNSVKVVLGFIELAFGLKFLSVADQTYHWGILDREIYIALWIVIFALMGIYLLGKIKFAHDSDMPYLGVPRLFLAIITFSFVVYLLPGMWGASLPGLAGYLPPTTSHDFDLPAIIRGEGKGTLCEEPKYTEKLHLPHGLKGYFDYEQAMQCAKDQKKPLFIDFTGHGCVNCRRMEDMVWADKEVLKRLQEDFVVVALYVDDRTELPESEWRKSKVDGKMKKTIGRINADIQICYFGSNAQPNYCLLDNNEELLAKPRGANYNVEEFIEFLDDAKKLFNKRYGIKAGEK
jgi:thiol:disulfide interchange protein DsbD